MQYAGEAQAAQRQTLPVGQLGGHVGETCAEADRDGVHVGPACAGVALQTLAQAVLHRFRWVRVDMGPSCRVQQRPAMIVGRGEQAGDGNSGADAARQKNAVRERLARTQCGGVSALHFFFGRRDGQPPDAHQTRHTGSLRPRISVFDARIACARVRRW